MMNFEELLVSGAPTEIYALSGSLFEFHETVMKPGRAETAGIQFLFQLYGGAYYRHTANLDMMIDQDHPWSKELIDLYNNEKHCHSASSVVLRIEDATIENSSIYCRKNYGFHLLYESFRFPDRVSRNFSEAAMREIEFSDFGRVNRSYLYIGSAGSFNYGHWLVDDLPRAKAWLELRNRLGIACTILLPKFGNEINEVRANSLRTLIDPLIDIEFISPERPYRVKNLYYATPVSFHPRIKNPAAIDFVRSRAAACLHESQDEPTLKLFVARRPPNSRSIVNFDELWTFLSARGFELIEAEKIDFASQATLFQNAKIVVGQMGAAMTNSLFCRPAISLIYLSPIGWAEPFYLDLAALGGQQYNLLAGPPVQDGPAYLSDFSIPVDQLYHRLTYMGFKDER